MGLYDTVWVECPKCKEKNGFQSKSGYCFLGNYGLENCPEDVLIDVNRHSPCKCDCGCLYEVDIENKTPIIIK